jgi:hypothetical protein
VKCRPSLAVNIVAPLLVLLAPMPVAADDCSAPPMCTSPVTADMLVGETADLNGAASEGFPSTFEWFVTPPGASVPTTPSATGASVPAVLSSSGLWSMGLRAHYDHQAVGGGLYCSQTCVAVDVRSVVASLTGPTQPVELDGTVDLDGTTSRWGEGIVPVVTWSADGASYGPCGGAVTTPSQVTCQIAAADLGVGVHPILLELRDPVSGDIATDEVSVEVIIPIPQTMDFTWDPFNQVPGEQVEVDVSFSPTLAQTDVVDIVWSWGDGTADDTVTCPGQHYTCFVWGHTWAAVSWYTVTATATLQDGEVLQTTHSIEIGDAPDPPVASLDLSTQNAQLRDLVTATFTGSCDGTCTYDWDFGDGATATGGGPVTHRYGVPGSYPVSVHVVGNGGIDDASTTVDVQSCWTPASTILQDGACYGGPVWLTAPAGTGWVWSTGAVGQTIAGSLLASAWVDVMQSPACWGFVSHLVVQANCGDPDGDADLSGSLDSRDLAAITIELTDGDGSSIVTAGGGDLTAPGGDVTRNGALDLLDLITILDRLFN